MNKNLQSRFEKQQTEFLSDVQFLKDQSGRVVCGNLLLCFDAGKPFELILLMFHSGSLLAK